MTLYLVSGSNLLLLKDSTFESVNQKIKFLNFPVSANKKY